MRLWSLNADKRMHVSYKFQTWVGNKFQSSNIGLTQISNIGRKQISNVGQKQISKVGWKHKTWQTVWMHFTSAPPLLHSLFFTFSPMIVIGNNGFVRNMREGWEMRNRRDYERVCPIFGLWNFNTHFSHISCSFILVASSFWKPLS